MSSNLGYYGDMPVELLIDSTNYLDPTTVERYGMRQVSLFINDGDKQEREMDMDYQAFYERLADTREIPKSAQPSQGAVRDGMLAILDEGAEVLGMTLSKEMSGTYDTFLMVAEQIKAERPDAVIEVVDTRSNCMQEGYAILSAAALADDELKELRLKKAVQELLAAKQYDYFGSSMEADIRALLRTEQDKQYGEGGERA